MIRRLIRDNRAAAAVEFVLALPMMLALLFVGLEAGHFFWTEHKLVKAVRDGARFAARSNIEDVCAIGSDGTLTNDLDAALLSDIQTLTVTGQILNNGQDASTLPRAKVPGWVATDVVVTPGCGDFVATGIYEDLGSAAALITVSSGPVPYPSILNGLGVLDQTFIIEADASAAVTGI
jgi:Flp pilus assembly protein TadG